MQTRHDGRARRGLGDTDWGVHRSSKGPTHIPPGSVAGDKRAATRRPSARLAPSGIASPADCDGRASRASPPCSPGITNRLPLRWRERCCRKSTTCGRSTALGGLAYALANIAPLFLMCDPRDVGQLVEVRSKATGGPTITLFDRIPEGMGLAERLYELHGDLLAGADSASDGDVFALLDLEVDPLQCTYIPRVRIGQAPDLEGCSSSLQPRRSPRRGIEINSLGTASGSILRRFPPGRRRASCSAAPHRTARPFDREPRARVPAPQVRADRPSLASS